MKAIVVTDEAAGTAGITLVERPEPEPAINDVVVQVHASGFTSGELTWPSTWTDRVGRDRTPSIPGQELAGWSPPSAMARRGWRWDSGCSASGTRIAAAGWRSMWRSGTQPRAAAGRRRLHGGREPADAGPDRLAGTVRPRPPSGGAERARARRGRQVGSMVTQLAREFGAYVIGAGRAVDVRRRSTSARWSSSTLRTTRWKTSAALTWCSTSSAETSKAVRRRDPGRRNTGDHRPPAEARPADGLAIDFVVMSDRAQLGEIVRRVRDGRLRTKSATSRPSTMPSRPSIRPSGSAGRRSSAFVRERHAPINGRRRRGGVGGVSTATPLWPRPPAMPEGPPINKQSSTQQSRLRPRAIDLRPIDDN